MSEEVASQMLEAMQEAKEYARSRVLMNEAAPDMLEALKAFVAHYPMGINPSLDDAFRSARAAISKAKG